jgi:hypothetical protein
MSEGISVSVGDVLLVYSTKWCWRRALWQRAKVLKLESYASVYGGIEHRIFAEWEPRTLGIFKRREWLCGPS